MLWHGFVLGPSCTSICIHGKLEAARTPAQNKACASDNRYNTVNGETAWKEEELMWNWVAKWLAHVQQLAN